MTKEEIQKLRPDNWLVCKQVPNEGLISLGKWTLHKLYQVFDNHGNLSIQDDSNKFYIPMNSYEDIVKYFDYKFEIIDKNHKCNCDILFIMTSGCKCGGI